MVILFSNLFVCICVFSIENDSLREANEEFAKSQQKTVKHSGKANKTKNKKTNKKINKKIKKMGKINGVFFA